MSSEINFPNPFKGITEGAVKGLADGFKEVWGLFKANPEKVLEHEEKLKQLEQDALAKAAELDQKREEAILKDMADARASNVQIQNSEKAGWMAKNIAYCIDAFVILLWGILTIYLIAAALKILKTSSVDLTGIYGLYAAVTGVAMTIINFHRGSSVGSKEKSKQIEALTK